MPEGLCAAGSDPASNNTHVVDRWFFQQDAPAPTEGSTNRHVVDRWFESGDPSTALHAEATPSLRAPAEPEPDTKRADD